MDVSVTISDKFQQFFIVFVKVPQLQFIERVVGFVVRRDRYTVQTVQKTGWCSSWIGTRPSLCNDRCVGQTVLKTVEVP